MRRRTKQAGGEPARVARRSADEAAPLRRPAGARREPAADAGGWSARERAVLAGLDSPAAIQAFLDRLAYRSEDSYHSPRTVLRERRAHCFDGALLAAAALRRLGQRPLLVELLAVNDDDHVLALHRGRHGWGAVAKSNFVGLRFREPVYRSVRELVLSYFELYFNFDREKTLRGYTRPLDLARFDRHNWMTSDAGVQRIAAALDRQPRVLLLTPAAARRLAPVDRRSFRAGTFGTDARGVWRRG